jgi:hypothetical protein
MLRSGSNFDENPSEDGGEESVGRDLQLGALRGTFALSVPNPQKITLGDLSAPSDAKKEDADRFVIEVVKKLRLVGNYHLPMTDKDFEEGFILFKIYIYHQSALLKEAYEKTKSANATLLYFQDATQNETKIENIERFKIYIVEAVFSGQELKNVIMTFPFAFPRLKDVLRDIIVYFKPHGGSYKMNEKSHYDNFVYKGIMTALERQPHHTIDFGATLDMNDWYKVLVTGHLLLKIIYQKQCKRRETITDKVRRETSKLVQDMMEEDHEELHWSSRMFDNITMFASDKPEMCNFKWIQLMFAHGSHVIADKMEYLDDAAKRKKNRIVSNMRQS